MTDNLWGERWSKLVANVHGQRDLRLHRPAGRRNFAKRAASPLLNPARQLIRVGQAQGYQLEEILHLPPEAIARAGEGDETAMRVCDEQRFKDGKRTSSQQRPSMGQDMQKGAQHN